MKITFLSPVINIGGGTRVLAIHAKHLAQRGHEVNVVATPPTRRPLRQRLRRMADRRALRTPLAHWRSSAMATRMDMSHFDGLEVPVHVIDDDRPIADRDVPDADVVVATWWETAEWVAGLSPRKGVKAYLVQHHEVFDYLPVERVRATWHMPLHKIVVSRWLADVAEREYGERNVWLVPNGVDCNVFHAPQRGRQAQPTVGLLYSSVGWKGCAVSLRALEIAAQRVSGLRVIAFGAEPVAGALPLPPGAIYHHLPGQQAIRALYASCDVWLCGSYSEGFCLPLLEAMACRCPVVTTRVGGAMDLVMPGRNGHVVPVGDAQALADRLVEMLSLDEASWRVMSDAALMTARRHTWEHAADLFEAAMFDMVDGRRAGQTGQRERSLASARAPGRYGLG